MILFLPPAPHTSTFFDNIRRELPDIETEAATYPGYGDVPESALPSIENYALALLPQLKGTGLVGFHTGCLVALEMAHQQPNLGPLILVDIPFFDEATKDKHRSGLNPTNATHAAFFAAFDYDLTSALQRCHHGVHIIATNSPLFDVTVEAADLIPSVNFIDAKDIFKPAFEHPAMTPLLRQVLLDNSQITHPPQT